MDTSGVIAGIARLYNLDPALIGIEMVTLMSVWSSTAANIVQPSVFQFEPGYDHVIFGIGAFKQLNDGNDPADNTRVEFQLNFSWENKPEFGTPLNFGAFTTTQGTANPIYLLPGFKKLQDRTTIITKFTASQFDNTWAGVDCVLGVILFGARLNTKENP